MRSYEFPKGSVPFYTVIASLLMCLKKDLKIDLKNTEMVDFP